jgi:uncharacterized protein (DUF1697 family)
VALLRGINLGPTNRVSMAALRDALAARRLEEVRTHLQSGNVILTSAERPAAVGGIIEACVACDGERREHFSCYRIRLCRQPP